MNKYKDSLANSIKILASGEVNKSNTPSFTTGRIIGISGEKYIVEIKGDQYIIPSLNGVTYTINKTVWICQPYGSTNVSEQFILGFVTS